jgi:hypothetical protein
MEDSILTSDLSLWSLSNFECRDNLMPKFDDVQVEAGAWEVMDYVQTENVPFETSLAS